MRGLAFSCFGALLACAGGVVAVAAPAAAQGSYSPYDESPAAALARYVRALAQDPKDFDSLIGAGRAALELGDTQAAAGFFARADAVDPRSPLPQAGMGAVSIANGDPKAAMPYFTRAQQLGATQTMLGCDRGLAYDLLGQQTKAQADYRAALSGADRDKARRRLALSLAISGDKAGALAMLAPLSAKGDSAVPRVRAFVLALTGDPHGAMTLIDAALPQGAASVAPFVRRLASLAPGQKAAAVNLGMFPDSNSGVAYAVATAPARPAPSATTPSAVKMAQTVSTDRLSGIDALLRTPSPAPAAQPVWQQPALDNQPQARPAPVQAAYVPEVKPATAQRVGAVMQPKIWLELSSGRDASALSDRFSDLKDRNPNLFKGIPGYVAQSGNRNLLIVGPFRGSSDANFFADDLQEIGVTASRWTNSASDRIVPIAQQ